MALESVLWVCPVCKRANRQLVEEGCAAPTEAIPVSKLGDGPSHSCEIMRREALR